MSDGPQKNAKKKREPILFTEHKKQVCVILCVNLYNRIANIANARHKSFAGTVQMLLYIALDEYERNQKAGIDTTVKRKQNKAKQEAEAMAKAAERERRKNHKKSDTITAVTPMLFQPDDEE